MELKRIIARDTRAANEKAIQLYGEDVLIISTQRVDNQTELIVAVDVRPEPQTLRQSPAFVPCLRRQRRLWHPRLQWPKASNRPHRQRLLRRLSCVPRRSTLWGSPPHRFRHA